MKRINTTKALIRYANNNDVLPVHIHINNGDLELQGIAITKESLMGAIKKLRINSKILSKEELLDIDYLLEAWETGGGGFSGGGASGNW